MDDSSKKQSDSQSSAPPFTDQTPWSEPFPFTPGQTSPYYNSTHHALRTYARNYINAHILPHNLKWERAGSAPASARQAWVRSGLAFTDLPSEYWPTSTRTTDPSTTGASTRSPAPVPRIAQLPPEELDPFHVLLLTDEKSRIQGGVVSSLEGASVIGIPPLLAHGTPQQKARWLPGLFDFSTSFCLGVTEPGGGSDVASVRTTAVKRPRSISAGGSGNGEGGYEYVVSGAKKWITGAPWASHMTTAVRTGPANSGVSGISVLIIPLRNNPGVRITRLENSGQNGGGASLVELDDAVVPADHLLGKEGEGFKILMRNFNRERFVLAVGCNRKARICLVEAVQYAHERETFGKLLVENQVIRRKFAELAHRVEAHWAWLEQIAWSVKQDRKGWEAKGIAGRIALAKVQGGQILEMAAREAQQVFGGKGYQRGEGRGGVVEQISRDLRMMVVGGGSEEIISDLAVKQETAAARKRGWKL